jgi:hypothetical protein
VEVDGAALQDVHGLLRELLGLGGRLWRQILRLLALLLFEGLLPRGRLLGRGGNRQRKRRDGGEQRRIDVVVVGTMGFKAIVPRIYRGFYTFCTFHCLGKRPGTLQLAPVWEGGQRHG